MKWEVDPDRITNLATEVTRLLSPEHTKRNSLNLKSYFDPKRGSTGGYFERLGARAHGPDEIGCHDLLSLTLLTDRPSGFLVRDLMASTSFKREVAALLREIDNVDLWLASDETLDAAQKLWDLLRDHSPSPRGHHMGPARVSKLLARKRPKLIPISDSVVRRALPMPRGIDRWAAYRTLFRSREDLVKGLRDLRPGSQISLLRTFDVIVWMGKAS